MLWVALAANAVAAAAFFATGMLAHVIRSLIREHARERQLMLNQLMHLAGRTWHAPPSEQWTVPLEEEEQPPVFFDNPPQLPDFYDPVGAE